MSTPTSSSSSSSSHSSATLTNTSSSSTSILHPPAITTSTQVHQSFSIKLTSKNYVPWKLQFTPLLNYYNLHGLINGTEPPPPKEIPDSETNQNIINPAYTNWFNRDQLLLSWLLSSITEEVYPQLIGLNSSSEVWNALATAYGVVSHAQRTQLHIELHNLSKDDKSVSQYLYQAKAIADSLTLSGQPIQPSEFNAIVFRKLGAKYNGIIRELQQRTDPISFNDLHGQLVSHEL